jgi:site-specific recombinase
MQRSIQQIGETVLFACLASIGLFFVFAAICGFADCEISITYRVLVGIGFYAFFFWLFLPAKDTDLLGN